MEDLITYDENFPLSKFYFPRPIQCTEQVHFDEHGNLETNAYGSVEHYEVVLMLIGRHVLKKSMQLFNGVSLGSSMACLMRPKDLAKSPRATAVVFPGAGTWFGCVDGRTVVTQGLSVGSWMPFYSELSLMHVRVVALCPALPKYHSDVRQAVYCAHVDYVMRHIPQDVPLILIGASLGGKILLETLPKFSAKICAIALIDSVCHDARTLPIPTKRLLKKVGRHWKAQMPATKRDGCKCVFANTERHELTPFSCKQDVIRFCEKKI